VYYLLIVLFISKCLISCQTVPKYCGLAPNQISALLSVERGSIDGGFDENGDGKVDAIEAFTNWDFLQIKRILHSGIQDQAYQWTNIDTCYRFKMKATDFYDDKSQKAVWQTCRDITVDVYSPDKQFIGSEKAKGCRHFSTHEWDIL